VSQEIGPPESYLPDDLVLLLPQRASGWRPPVRLPAGHLVNTSTVLRPVVDANLSSWPSIKDFPRPPVCWLSDEPVTVGLWSRLRAEHHRCGLWPLLLFEDTEDGAFGFYGEDESSLAQLDAALTLARWWEGLGTKYFASVGAKDIRGWPGLAPPGTSDADPDRVADEVAEAMVAGEPATLALVPAPRSADTLGLAGWTATDNEDYFAGALSSVVRSWENRYGARVIAVGSGTLWLSVAAPPATVDHAAEIAVEHFTFCPEVEPRQNFEYDPERPQFLQYAESIVDQRIWRFWWD
jgi:uncharacterized protein DUF4253